MIAFQTPITFSEISALRLARPSVGRTQWTSQTLPFSTAAQLQARDSKRPKRDPRLSPSPLKLVLLHQTERMFPQG